MLGSTEGDYGSLETVWCPVTSYFLIGSYYDEERLDRLRRKIVEMSHPDFSLVINEQRGSARKPKGYARVYNALVKVALADPDCEFIWLLGDDVSFSGDIFTGIEQLMRNDPTIGAMTPTEAWVAKGTDSTLVTVDRAGTTEIAIRERLDGTLEDLVFAGFAFVCIRRAACEAVGPMDESLGKGYCEDLDWGIRCWQVGYRCVSTRSFYFQHERGATFNQLVKEGLYGAQEPYETADRAKVKWPFLWAESNDATVERMRAMRRAALDRQAQKF